MILLSYSNFSIKGTEILGSILYLFFFYDRPFLYVCNLEENLSFSTLILGSVFNDYVVFYRDIFTTVSHEWLEKFWYNCQGIFTSLYWWPDKILKVKVRTGLIMVMKASTSVLGHWSPSSTLTNVIQTLCVCFVSLVRWNEICQTASLAIQELLHAWQNGAVNSEKITVRHRCEPVKILLLLMLLLLQLVLFSIIIVHVLC